jgi:three-Cys-motif partner protein
MAAPRATVWELEPHTRAKHEILRRYLQAWMIILSQGRFPEILYIDGFAGPGEYSGGEVGSPIIALDTALAYKPPLTAKVHFLFVDKDEDRATHLRKLIEQRTLPNNFSVVVEGGGETFEEAFDRHYPQYLRNGRLMPTFAFIDPFGWTGAPLTLVQKISQRSCEVFVNFMYEEINRFIGHPDQVANFDSFFGTDAWRTCVEEIQPRTRNRCLHDLYMRQLGGTAEGVMVRSFEMSNSRDVTDYYLFYATKELLGLKKMKEAMWRIDESGEFRFSDATDPNQLILFEKTPNFAVLRDRIVQRFTGKDVSVAAIEQFVVTETAFRETHYKALLKSMEKETGNLTVVKAREGRKSGTFPDPDMIVRIS